MEKWVRPGFSPAHPVANDITVCSDLTFLAFLSYKLEGIFSGVVMKRENSLLNIFSTWCILNGIHPYDEAY